MSHKLFELDVRLKEIEPPIWRTIEVPGACSLEDVHFAIQVAMGWTNSHLHQFKIDDQHYGMADVDDTGDLDLEDEREYRLQDLVEAGGKFVYEYDFGDGWEHDVTVKKITTVSKPPRYRCVAGARACPPEDCGGSGGYENLLKALANPDHEEHDSLVTWSNDFKPERFTLPKNGLDLRADMDGLRAFAEDDDEHAETAPRENRMMDLPKPLVKAVLGLPPMARASLAAMIAGSLADEVEHARSMVDEIVTAVRLQKQARHTGRSKRSRS